MAGLLTANVQWVESQQLKYLERGLKALTREHQVDFGCAVENLSFEYNGKLQTSKPDQILMFFMLRLIHRLNQLGPAPPADLTSYARSMGLFRDSAARSV